MGEILKVFSKGIQSEIPRGIPEENSVEISGGILKIIPGRIFERIQRKNPEQMKIPDVILWYTPGRNSSRDSKEIFKEKLFVEILKEPNDNFIEDSFERNPGSILEEIHTEIPRRDP